MIYNLNIPGTNYQYAQKFVPPFQSYRHLCVPCVYCSVYLSSCSNLTEERQ